MVKLIKSAIKMSHYNKRKWLIRLGQKAKEVSDAARFTAHAIQILLG